MGKTVYTRCCEILKETKHNKISRNSLMRLITMFGGSDERTIQSYFKTMLNTKLIKDLGSGQFEIL